MALRSAYLRPKYIERWAAGHGHQGALAERGGRTRGGLAR